MSTQPVLWEHAFINPKDPSFMIFFLIALEFGFRMADHLANAPSDERPGQTLKRILLPAILLGLTTSIRIIGPLVAVLVILYFLLLKKQTARFWWFIPYGLISILAMYVTWPFLWADPIKNFFSTLTFMSDNPTELRVLFYGQLYRADNLPIRYLPSLLLFQLTEPVWPLVALGGIAAVFRAWKKAIEWKSLLATILWFAIPFFYVLWQHPPMYDSFRHFMFIVPPLFVLAGLTIETLFNWLQQTWLRVAIILALLAPGLIADVQLHPYQYTYYNQFVGGTGQAAYQFETDYWETCYKDAMQTINKNSALHPLVYARREGYIAAYYAAPGVTVRDASKDPTPIKYGDYILSGSRADPGIQKYRNNINLIVIKRDNAVFCTIELYTK